MHSHDAAQPWMFADTDNTAAIACTHVSEAGLPILRVTHDSDDGMWQFLCGQAEPHEVAEGRIVCLACVVAKDPSLGLLHALPLGWSADREDTESSWIRSELPPWEDEGRRD